ncbi:coproporphyrinogen dehydrogenase HemZ [Schnuerera sp. xch1]|uniref:coproporphyrinogen dehydrogenase HemZ n=1 Tax=Schnuerera sp. xch1 TaxID=2874283 RepID=UPI001CBC4DCF|nr:coproporphyrinogen dehydrogenase HemZ [Schnuerera sp. xch1]MBZ2173963.1 coproporphyrinogen dehydrogenase HemZ [Schnuerera sp. xch1]
MIYVHLIGHNFRYEIRELIKAYYFSKKIVFIDDLDEYDNGILIENVLYNNIGQIRSITKVYIDHSLIFNSSIQKIEQMNIGKHETYKKIKIGVKQSLYEALNNISNTILPWGILTGVRPVKIVHDLIDNGFKDNEILNILTEQYKIFSEKANLILNIAHKQRNHIHPLDKNRFSLYVSIPFCPTRCLYCSFPSCNIGKYGYLVDKYTDNLIYEINRIAELMSGKSISTVYIGGGTPSAIPNKNLEKIIKTIYKNFGRNNIDEITVEAGRPDTIDVGLLKMLKENEVDRISINPQTMNDSTLKVIGRQHNSDEIINAYNLAKNVGIGVVNMDLIVGLPSEGIDEIENTLEKLKYLDPENLTVHTLAIKRGSKFRHVIDQYDLKDQNELEAMLKETKLFAEEMNLKPYYLYRQKQIMGNFENVGYAKEGKECIYNIKMMEEKETIIAVGMGAVSKIFYPKENRIERVPNVKSLKEYLERIDEMVARKVNFMS